MCFYCFFSHFFIFIPHLHGSLKIWFLNQNFVGKCFGKWLLIFKLSQNKPLQVETRPNLFHECPFLGLFWDQNQLSVLYLLFTLSSKVLVVEVHRRVMTEYVRAIMRGRIICTSLKMRKRMAGRLRDEGKHLKALFKELVSHFSNIIYTYI